MPVDQEKGRRDLSMAHNVLDGTDRLLKFLGQEPRWLVMGTSARVSVEHNVSYHPYEIDSVTPID